MALRVHRATTSPASPPAIARSIDSASSCATMCLRPAPIERRTAISVARAAARPRSRFATFAQQISSTRMRHAEKQRQRTTGFVRCAALALRAGRERISMFLKRSSIDGLMPC